MKVLVIGGGGREHALARKFMQSPNVDRVYCAPGNPGMLGDGIDLVPLAVDQVDELLAWAQEAEIDWTFVGPEQPLFLGIVDRFRAAGQKIFGPSQAAARLESSKKFAKELLIQNGIPTAHYQAFEDYKTAQAYVQKASFPLVIKADGPAAGKGVVIAQDLATAEAALVDILEADCYGSQSQVVVEEYLTGPEFSFFSLVHDGQVLHLPTAQDHKRAYDQDRGPNTGGMGAYAPVPFVDEGLYQEVVTTIVEPTLQAMEAVGYPYSGVLYTGLMLTAEGPKVIEFNTRFGDPETQILMPLLGDDFADTISQLLDGQPAQLTLKENRPSLGVVLAAEGYPNPYAKGMDLSPLVNACPADISLLYAGVGEKSGRLIAQGGRILMAVAQGDDLVQAAQQVYAYLDQNPIPQTFYRHDIGGQVISHSKEEKVS
ncbi:phosphoribosylamine--glycine ligase [Aerococcus sanguinicola]|uniref:phosphoribosylamine--glycine ligase n=1 Tax=unclassified Aerococcus TaxID=2618060 RepID=UPI0008A1D92A|nr:MULTISPECIES: phosphoribosylamine--glycine ligase [unclassified Aerococcus]KAB0646705.1 phosphoribosylamine--glycine ligase [Aerococcus sanguinicola]MDK6233852.1 phosphoribosylamine--glycine ligase [Aerococcus sp. UMB10185]MDK6856317.1 phosphoribosylamine--glycine ligase [Aerococcus sp. UMB7533]MDK8503134.1 phosphoribosylamine--glycine ligase [Aerococcus sp. UMB1112A]OFN04672.1 phosphoribosylamine--glycine ligase [Aerococcus sp. HMSC062A02]